MLPAVTQSPLQTTLERLLATFLPLTDGELATYIPELGQADPSHFGIAVATVDGHVYRAGDHSVPFTIQSISKPFVYGLALDDRGIDAVLAKVGVEPSGEAFNAISLEPGSGRPRNPMINAGAIATASLVAGHGTTARFNRVQAMLSAYAGHELAVDESVFTSEHETGHRNRAIGHLLRNANIIDGNVDEVCDRYFRQCSVLVNCSDLALMAATLANGGVNPVTGARAVNPPNVQRVLSVMSTCGMYDASGAWVYRVGMPAKSGVGGGILAILPGQLGIGVFSPRLDAFGNSVRGVAVCEALSKEFGLHLLRPPIEVRTVVRATRALSEVQSKRRRAPAETECLDRLGERVHIVELQGPLVFSTAEVALRQALETLDAGDTALFDTRRVTAMEPSVCRLFGMFAGDVAATGGATVFAPVRVDHEWAGRIREAAGPGAPVHFFAEMDAALEWCEDGVLEAAGRDPTAAAAEVPFEAHPLVAGLEGHELQALAKLARRLEFAPGERIASQDEPADQVFLLCSGRVEVSVGGPAGARHRLASLDPGTTFGEQALLGGGPRSADVSAVGAATCYALAAADLEALDWARPGVRAHLLERVASDLSERLRRANAEVTALAR
jgi:glutaminase